MPFPDVITCIVSDDVRLETGGKASILGFYGILPNVDILIRDLNRPMEKLTFLFLARPGGMGTYKAVLTITSPSGKKLIDRDAPPLDVSIADDQRKVTVVLGLLYPVFNERGTYVVELLIDGRSKYSSTFAVAQGTPEQLK